MNVEGASGRVHRDGRVVGRSLAALDGLVDLAVLAIDLRRAKLHDLAVRLVSERVLARRRRGLVGERLEDHLVEAGREAVLEDRRHRQIAQRAAVVSGGGRLSLLEKALRGPRVLFVGARFRRLDVLDVFANVFLLRPNRQDLAQRLQLLVGLARLGVEVGERAQGFDVFRRELERPLVERDRLRLEPERAVGARRGRERPCRIGLRSEQPVDPPRGGLLIAAHHREIDPLVEVVGVVEAERRVAIGRLVRLGRATDVAKGGGVDAQEGDRARISFERGFEGEHRGAFQTRLAVELDASEDAANVERVAHEHLVVIRRGVAPVGAGASELGLRQEKVDRVLVLAHQRLCAIEPLPFLVAIVGQLGGEQMRGRAWELHSPRDGRDPGRCAGPSRHLR